MLSHSEQESILSDFPNIKLSYENVAHKKVYSDIMVAIPCGKKCFIWFTEYDDKNVCFLLELGEKKQIQNIQIIQVDFHYELVYNTIFYGTLFYESKTRLFSIEDIFYYKGQNVTQCNWLDKMSIISKMLEQDLKQTNPSTYLFFGIPIFSNDSADLLMKTKEVKYRIYSIQFRSYNRVNNYLHMHYDLFRQQYNNHKINNYENITEPHITNTNANINTHTKKTYEQKSNKETTKKEATKKEKIFKVKPDIQNDIYHLYCLNNNNEETLFDTACIPDFTTSVMMNRLFRTIKENANLDALEESDDEEEFQNEKEDRFVHLERNYNMICNFNYKFRKWVPVKIADGCHTIYKQFNQ
jgi:hypothetical protein